MSLIAKAKGGQPAVLIPEGLHVARCYQVVDLGTQFSQLYAKKVHQVRLGWEFPKLLHEFTPGKGKEPFAIGQKLTVSLSEKSNLYGMLVSWRGRPFTQEELDGFHLKKILGAPCKILVEHITKDGVTKSKFANLMKIGGEECPPAILPQVYYEVEMKKNDIFQSLPEWMQDDISQCEEWKAPPANEAAAVDNDDSGSVPF